MSAFSITLCMEPCNCPACRREIFGALCEREERLRRPQPPGDLVNALQDSIHFSVGMSRPVLVVKIKKDEET
jgi:hypothetical protein